MKASWNRRRYNRIHGSRQLQHEGKMARSKLSWGRSSVISGMVLQLQTVKTEDGIFWKAVESGHKLRCDMKYWMERWRGGSQKRFGKSIGRESSS